MDCRKAGYADYQFYLNNYGNTISENEFHRLSIRASDFLDYYTRNNSRLHPDMYELKMACCALAEQYMIADAWRNNAVQASVNASGVKSETVGAHSVSYQTGSELALGAQAALSGAEDELVNIAKRYLAHTGLLYRGGC